MTHLAGAVDDFAAQLKAAGYAMVYVFDGDVDHPLGRDICVAVFGVADAGRRT